MEVDRKNICVFEKAVLPNSVRYHLSISSWRWILDPIHLHWWYNFAFLVQL